MLGIAAAQSLCGCVLEGRLEADVFFHLTVSGASSITVYGGVFFRMMVVQHSELLPRINERHY